MQEDNTLMSLAENEDDVPVALCLLRNGQALDWQAENPEAVLYIPENLLERVATAFMRGVGAAYYDAVPLSGARLTALINELQAHAGGADAPGIGADRMLAFIRQAQLKASTHQLVFDGP